MTKDTLITPELFRRAMPNMAHQADQLLRMGDTFMYHYGNRDHTVATSTVAYRVRKYFYDTHGIAICNMGCILLAKQDNVVIKQEVSDYVFDPHNELRFMQEVFNTCTQQ